MVCDSCTICIYALIQELLHLIEQMRALTRWDNELDQFVFDSRHRHDAHGPAELNTWALIFSNL